MIRMSWNNGDEEKGGVELYAKEREKERE